ncbi:MAG: sulfite exporter TauE/SafE family protein, partial [Clostridia bacterium]|nr:sulfite exporter TauE/SafE family protein [Clostridia bacterium]
MKKDKKEKIILAVSGTVVGIINGFFGGGGGMIVVPVLTSLLKKPVKKAHATAILIILPVTIAGALTYFLSGSFEWVKGLTVSAGVTVGGFIGALLLGKIK